MIARTGAKGFQRLDLQRGQWAVLGQHAIVDAWEGVAIGNAAEGGANIAQQSIVHAVNPAMHMQSLAPRPGVLNRWDRRRPAYRVAAGDRGASTRERRSLHAAIRSSNFEGIDASRSSVGTGKRLR